MRDTPFNPLLRPLSVFLVGLSLSIGWGIRGDFGHEAGAWIPGALAAMAVCLLSGRDDWRRRVAYCALFGGLGWGFGGSVAYMYTMAFAGSGDWDSVWYGYFAVFLVGGLWAGLGAAGMTLPLCLDRERLNRIFTPLCFVLVAIGLGDLALEPVANWLSTPGAVGMDATWSRQKSPLYWFDADWWPATWALLGVCGYDLWERGFAGVGRLIAYALIGALAGLASQAALDQTGLTPRLVSLAVVPQGDVAAVDPETGKTFDPANLMTNWPQFFGDYPRHVGWLIGISLGVGVYFLRHGRWRDDSGLFLAMALGWLIAFLLMPVLGSIPLRHYGGFRLTPPRSDDWAGILGVFVGASVYFLRGGMVEAAYAGALNFVLGGFAFATMHFLRALAMIPGHPALNRATGGTPPPWSHYQSANWHSILEQSQGFGLGIATAITMASTWRKLGSVRDERPGRRWTDVFAVGFVVFFMTYMNVIRNIHEWTMGDRPLVPAVMKAPLIAAVELSAGAWFTLAWCAIGLSFLALLIVHQGRGLAVVPASWLGKGQILYFLVLWIMVIADFERSLSAFREARLVTEWVIILNASLATFLVMVLPGAAVDMPALGPRCRGVRVAGVWLLGLPVAAVFLSLYAMGVFRIYADSKPAGAQYRWGDQATWRVRPIMKNRAHR